MFKVICIDNKDGSNKVASILLVEGKTYNVSQSPIWGDSYIVDGILFNPKNGHTICFKKHRFIPLSEIDEMELVNNNKEVEA